MNDAPPRASRGRWPLVLTLVALGAAGAAACYLYAKRLPHCPPPPEATKPPAISNVNLAYLSDAKRPDVLACDMRNGLVMVLRPTDPAPSLKVLTSEISNPAHTEVVDLDGDGAKDVLVANL